MSASVIADIQAELESIADARVKESQSNFFKESIVLHGVTLPTVQKIAKRRFKDVQPLGKNAVFAICEELLKTGYFEESAIAFEWAYSFRKEYEESDFAMFEGWVGLYVDNWAKCDGLCNHSIGAFVEMYPAYVKELKRWAMSDNRWFRRAAAVTLILPARGGMFLADVFEIAGILLMDRDDLVQKGYGWMLKEAAKAHQQEVFDYVFRNRAVMPRTALRYAIEKMPLELKKRAMAKV